jgi:hypothetical protein
MNEQHIAALALCVTSLPIIFMALRFRAGRNLEVISSYRPERIHDHQGFGRFIGFWILALGALMLGLSAALYFLTESQAAWASLGAVALMQLPVLRLVFGPTRFYYK